MNKIAFISFLFSILCISCSTNQKEKKSIIPEVSVKTDQPQTILPNDSGIVNLNLAEGKASALIQKKKDQTVYIVFSSQGYKKIDAQLSSTDSLANIRFSQIFLPNGTMDGPFGRELTYDLPIDGVYKVSVHENMMAGDPWSGLLKVQIELTK